MLWIVTGGEFKTTAFNELVEGTEEEHGPYKTYDEARNKWLERSWRTVDNCHIRFEIKEKVNASS